MKAIIFDAFGTLFKVAGGRYGQDFTVCNLAEILGAPLKNIF